MTPDPTSHARDELRAVCATAGTLWPVAGLADPPASARPAAVLVLFGVLDSLPARSGGHAVGRELDVLLTRRSPTLGHHPGQVSFPGGRLELDDDGPVGAALREAAEETGLDPSGVDVLGTLPELSVSASNHRVIPVVGWWTRPSEVVAVDHDETVAVFRTPVADLLDPDRRRTATLSHGTRTFRSPAFLLDEHVVWGFTAFVLDGLFDALGWTEPWDTTRTIPAPV